MIHHFLLVPYVYCSSFFFFQAEDGIRDLYVTGVQTCALPISERVRAIDLVGREVAEAFALAAARRAEMDVAQRRTEASLRAYQQDLTRANNLLDRKSVV